ncbi:hypothetical protein BD311DRAFT_827913 [Dichomitus squalens]|uniref:Uncharacterized protein n=1 Tax=Dichomitus squalens TaxID=114155 RepID=A0A4Q9M498_9APHY|nr:hypothetical protein BD311DRAFT_827913 [Dichomitus squalens]
MHGTGEATEKARDPESVTSRALPPASLACPSSQERTDCLTRVGVGCAQGMFIEQAEPRQVCESALGGMSQNGKGAMSSNGGRKPGELFARQAQMDEDALVLVLEGLNTLTFALSVLLGRGAALLCARPVSRPLPFRTMGPPDALAGPKGYELDKRSRKIGKRPIPKHVDQERTEGREVARDAGATYTLLDDRAGATVETAQGCFNSVKPPKK